MIALGLDVAREGADKSVATIRDNYRVIAIETWSKEDIVASSDRTEHLWRRFKVDSIIVDCDGLGVGVFDILRKRDLPVVPFHAQARTDRLDDTGELGFSSMRAYAWWNLRSLLDPAKEHGITFPKDDDLIGDLCAPKWRIISGSRILIESKDDIKKRLGRSPDKGDSLAYCFVDMEPSLFETHYQLMNNRDVDQLMSRQGTDRTAGEETPSMSPSEWENLLWRGAYHNHDVFG